MSREAADTIWGAEAVDLALKEPNSDEVTTELVNEILARIDPPGALRAWVLAQSWPRFCAIVRVVSGAIIDEVMKHGEG
jgi:hypothetical protein